MECHNSSVRPDRPEPYFGTWGGWMSFELDVCLGVPLSLFAQMVEGLVRLQLEQEFIRLNLLTFPEPLTLRSSGLIRSSHGHPKAKASQDSARLTEVRDQQVWVRSGCLCTPSASQGARGALLSPASWILKSLGTWGGWMLRRLSPRLALCKLPCFGVAKTSWTSFDPIPHL